MASAYWGCGSPCNRFMWVLVSLWGTATLVMLGLAGGYYDCVRRGKQCSAAALPYMYDHNSNPTVGGISATQPITKSECFVPPSTRLIIAGSILLGVGGAGLVAFLLARAASLAGCCTPYGLDLGYRIRDPGAGGSDGALVAALHGERDQAAAGECLDAVAEGSGGACDRQPVPARVHGSAGEAASGLGLGACAVAGVCLLCVGGVLRSCVGDDGEAPWDPYEDDTIPGITSLVFFLIAAALGAGLPLVLTYFCACARSPHPRRKPPCYWGCRTRGNLAAWAVVTCLAVVGAVLLVLGLYDITNISRSPWSQTSSMWYSKRQSFVFVGPALLALALEVMLIYFIGCSSPRPGVASEGRGCLCCGGDNAVGVGAQAEAQAEGGEGGRAASAPQGWEGARGAGGGGGAAAVGAPEEQLGMLRAGQGASGGRGS
ncbi:hypothetical protein HYH03_018582 [Edaphochlamys debaryana]|uniref:Uncharacterized protein n=1 Tax=Edaphochlamys debaryana TaxID=47281 RepID=A0A835XFP9_9CHLO|nr:hypothetical protein HYH03_018582 [Edaphochlamys debaryana]|eukprot:KAG2482475.1 hypothetical protein HYH03_018582 [Edaphochlamys debaryana]